MSDKITVEQLLSSDISLLDTYIRKIEALEKTYVSFVGAVQNNGKKLEQNDKKLTNSLKEYEKQLKKVNITIKSESDSVNNLVSSVNEQAKSLTNVRKLEEENIAIKTKLAKEQEKLSKAGEKLNSTQRANIKLQEKLTSLDSKAAQENARLRLAIQNKNKALKESAQNSLKLVDAYQKESKRLDTLRAAYKAVAVQEGLNSRSAVKLRGELTKLDAKLKNVDASAGQFQRNVGGYTQALNKFSGGFRQLAGALGFAGVIFLLVGAFKNAFSTIRSFQKENAVLAGVLGKTRAEIKELTADAVRLGGVTAKSASEVTQLQIAYARLGFTQQEIIDLTSGTINGSIALNAELGKTAELTGAIIRTFDDLTTTDAGDVLDKLTLATQKSALNFEKLETAIPIVAGAANAAGVPFTRLLALLGKLSDAGIDASSSSTALRNIFIESAAQGLNYEQILVKIAKNQDKLTAANDEFGKRAAVSGTILANLVEEVGLLDTTLQSAAGTAKKVAEEQLDTLDGKVIELSSSWEGFILSIESGDGVIGQFVRGSLEALTSALRTLAQTTEQVSAGVFDGLIKKGYTATQILENVEDGTWRFNEATEKQLIILAKQRQVFDLQTDAINMFDIAQKDGIETYEDFVKVQGEFLSNASSEEEQLVQLTKVKSLYDEQIAKGTEKTDAQIKAEEKQRLLREYAASKRKEQAELEIEYFEKFGAAIKENGDDVRIAGKVITDELSVKIPDSIDKTSEAIKSTVTRLSLFLKKSAEDIKLTFLAAFDAASIGVNQFFTNQSIRRADDLAAFEEKQNKEIDKLDQRRDRELQNESLTAEAKEQINLNYNSQIQNLERQTELKRKQAQKREAEAEKKARVFEAIINTLSAVVQALPNIPLSIAVGAVGTINTAAIISQPIPAFAEGTKSSPFGTALVGEAGRELILTPDGGVKLAKEPQLIDLPGGSEVLTNAMTEPILAKAKLQMMADGVSAGNFNQGNELAALNPGQAAIIKELAKSQKQERANMVDAINDAFSNLPEIHQFHFGALGLSRDRKRGNTTEKRIKKQNDW